MKTLKMWGLVGMLMLAALTTLVSCAPTGNQEGVTPKVNASYTIEKVTPEILVVVAYSQDGDASFKNGLGYGPALRQGLKTIGEQYIIESVTPVDYLYGHANSGYGSATKELIVKVRPR